MTGSAFVSTRYYRPALAVGLKDFLGTKLDTDAAALAPGAKDGDQAPWV
jgi:hypothetical protein